MIDNSKEYILCAAIWYNNGSEAPRGFIAQNISSGVVVGQWRHGNVINAYRQLTGNPTIGEVQGFITSKGNFVDRWQGMKLAYEAGQVDEQRAFRPIERLHDEAISDEELMEGEPQYRSGKMCGRYNMMFSEDLY